MNKLYNKKMRILRTLFWVILLLSTVIMLLIIKVLEGVERYDVVFAFYLLMFLMATLARISKKLEAKHITK